MTRKKIPVTYLSFTQILLASVWWRIKYKIIVVKLGNLVHSMGCFRPTRMLLKEWLGYGASVGLTLPLRQLHWVTTPIQQGYDGQPSNHCPVNQPYLTCPFSINTVNRITRQESRFEALGVVRWQPSLRVPSMSKIEPLLRPYPCAWCSANVFCSHLCDFWNP